MAPISTTRCSYTLALPLWESEGRAETRGSTLKVGAGKDWYSTSTSISGPSPIAFDEFAADQHPADFAGSCADFVEFRVPEQPAG